jgi:hypothetical protein
MRNARWIASPLLALCLAAAPGRAHGGDAERSGAAALQGPVPRDAAPPGNDAIRECLGRGVEFLLRSQNPNGSWGSARRTKDLNIYAPPPGAHHAFRAGVTSLCVTALVEVDDHSDAVRDATARGRLWLVENLPVVRRANADAIYNVWTHAYAIQALARLIGHTATPDDAKPRLRELIASQIELLERYESVDGGWGYYDFRVGTQKPSSDSTSFTTATVLVALREAKDLGIEAPPKLVERAIASILRQRKPDFSYLYGEYLKSRPMRGINRPGGSLGRSQACNIALRLWGDERVTNGVLATWLNRLFARNLWLDIGRKRPVPHEAWFQVAGYFYYYGHYYAALVIDALPPRERPPFQRQLATTLIRLQERNDGSWWDYPLYDYHQPYGTAFALMALKRCFESEP